MQTYASPLGALALLAACAPVAPTEPALRAAVARMDCGLDRAMRDRFTPGQSRASRLEWPTRACVLPVPQDIALACAVPEAAATGGLTAEQRPAYRFPDYRARNLRCAFTDAGQSEADCAFELRPAGEPRAWRRVRAHFVYRFRDVSNEVEHDSFQTAWETDAVCRARPQSSYSIGAGGAAGERLRVVGLGWLALGLAAFAPRPLLRPRARGLIAREKPL